MNPADFTCSIVSRQTDESLYGTVKPVDVWFLLDYNARDVGGWVHGVVKKSTAEGALAPILQHLTQVPKSKVLFIRRSRPTGKQFYIAIANQAQPQLYAVQVDDYRDLLELNISSIGAGKIPTLKGQPLEMIEDVVYAVCTNGKHDICCAKLGTPFYDALSKQGVPHVWQTSHIGGHRFAATMYIFPYAICYGRLDPTDAPRVVTAQSNQQILSEHFRGRSVYAGFELPVSALQAAQTAEVSIRQQTGFVGFYDLILLAVEEVSDTQWQVDFQDAKGRTHRLTVEQSMTENEVLSSCSEPPKHLPIYRILQQVNI